MTNIFYAVLLGIVEGITEFLPISSTAHLRICQYFLGISLEDEFWKLFAVFIQLGAILAVVYLYRERCLKYIKTLAKPSLAGLIKNPLLVVCFSFLFTAVPAFLLKKLIGHNLENLYVMAAALFVGGVVMLVIDRLCKSPTVHSVETVPLWKAAWIGLVQTLAAVFPGTSRSMSTIAAAQVVGLNRSAALDFSFLLSIPTMFVATIYDLVKYRKELSQLDYQVTFSTEQLLVLAIGFIVSMVVAYIVVAWFLNYVKRHGFFWFSIYRIIIAIVVVVLLRN